MSCCEENAACPCNQSRNSEHPYCHPYMSEHLRNVTFAETSDEKGISNRQACGDYCYQADHENFDTNTYHQHFKNIKETRPLGNFICYPSGKVLCCTDCKKNDCTGIIKAENVSEIPEGVNFHEVRHQRSDSEDFGAMKGRPCCEKLTSRTEPGIYQCDPCDPGGAAIVTDCLKEKPKKAVRFADEVVKPEDCERAFRNLDIEDVKHLCACCKECAIIGKEQCVGKPVLVYEFPEQKLEDTSVTHKDFCWQKVPIREVPPWHPNIKDRWRHLDVPSLCATTYQCDFKPHPISFAERKPVYLAPQREKVDPCQKLAEEYRSWKKTSNGEKRTCHSTCNECDQDSHRVQFHECNVAHLPPQYQCHGDGHLCQSSFQTAGENFTLCEKGDPGESRYWWKRTCCASEKEHTEKLTDLPPDLTKPVCPSYTTTYKHDFRKPYQQQQSEKLYFGNCTVCNSCSRAHGGEQPNLLCTKNTREPFITQRAGIV